MELSFYPNFLRGLKPGIITGLLVSGSMSIVVDCLFALALVRLSSALAGSMTSTALCKISFPITLVSPSNSLIFDTIVCATLVGSSADLTVLSRALFARCSCLSASMNICATDIVLSSCVVMMSDIVSSC